MSHKTQRRRDEILGSQDWLPMAALLLPVAVLVVRSAPFGAGCAAVHSALDARFFAVILEWGFLHLDGSAAPGTSVWSPPFFYPARHILAYADNLFAGQVFYAPLRWIGLAPPAALFVFHLLQRALTPLVTYSCLRTLRVGRWPSSVGAAVFSWGWIRYFHSGHIQLAAGYPIPLFFTALYFAVHRRRPWALVLMAWTVLFTWYVSLYTVVFFVLGTLALAGVQLLVPGGARELRAVVRAYGRFARSRPRRAAAVVALCLVAGALILPSFTVYTEVHGDFGPARKAEVRRYWGDVFSWVRPPEDHRVLGELHDDFPPVRGGLWEKTAFLGWLGFAGLVLPLAGFVIRWRRIHSLWPRSLLVVSGAGVVLMLIFSSYGGSRAELPFWLLHEYFPGVGGVRAPTRIAFVVSWLAVLCLATHLERIAAHRGLLAKAGAGALGLALLAESLAPVPHVVDRCGEERIWNDTARHLCPRIPRDEIGTVLFLPARIDSIQRVVQTTLAMRFALRCDVSVVNGYSGRRPESLAPLFAANPQPFPCGTLREVADRAHTRSGKGVLVFMDRGQPMGPPDVPPSTIAECLEPCLEPKPDWYVEQPGRPAEVFVTDPSAQCRPPSSR